MDDEAFADAYRLFTGDGYGGSPEEFYTLMNDNEDARNDALEIFRKNGYHGDMSSFEGLLGVNQLAPELEERAESLFGGEVNTPTLGGRDSSWGAAGAEALQSEGINRENIKEQMAQENKEEELLQGDFTPWLEAWKKENRPGGAHIPRDLYVRLEAEFNEKKKTLLDEFPAIEKEKSEHDKIILGEEKSEDNIFKGLEFDAAAINLGKDYDSEYFQEWVEDAKDGKISQYASDRLEKNGPTEGMTNWAKDKYGYTAKDEIVQAVEMDPTSPWSEYFFPLSTFDQTYKTGPDTKEWLQKEESHWETEQATESGEMIHPDRQRRRTKIIDKKGILNPNFQKTLYFDPNDSEASARAPEIRIEDEVWDNLSAAEKQSRILAGEGDFWQQQEINDKYGDEVAVLAGKFNAINTGADGKPLDLNFTPSSIDDYANLYTFFTGESINDAYTDSEIEGLIFTEEGNSEFKPSYDLMRYIDDPFANTKRNFKGHEGYQSDVMRRHFDKNKKIIGKEAQIKNQLGIWWEEYQKKPLVQAFMVDKDERGNQLEYKKLLEKADGDEKVLLKDINKEIMSLPEMKWGYQGVNTAQNQINEFKRQKKEDRYKMDYMGDEWIDEQIDYWENWKDKLSTEWGYGKEAFDEEGMYIQDFEADSDIPEDAYTGPGSMWYDKEVVGTHGTPEEILKSYNNDKDRLGEAIVHKRAELQRLINVGSKSTAGMGGDRGNIQKLVGGISNYIDTDNESWHRDAKTLQKMAKSGKLDSDFRDIRSNHPLAQQINQVKQQLVAMNMAYSLDIDPTTTEKELHAGFGSGLGSAVDALTFAVSGEKIFDNIEGYGKDELAESFIGALEQDGITIPQTARDRIDKSMGELTRDITMPLIPLIAEIMLFKKAGGKQIGNMIDNVADLIKYESRLARNSPKLNWLISTVVGGTVKKGTKYQHVMQASAVKEMTYLAGADLIGGSIYGREAIDPLFGFSMGAGMATVEKNMINSAAKRIPFFTPLMNMIGRQTLGRSNLLKGSWQTAKGAGIGTGIMSVSQGVVALKDYYIDRDQHALLEEFNQLTDMDHIVATYLSMHMLGIKGNKLYDNLSKDFNSIVRGDTPQYRAARKTLGLKKIKEPEVDLQQVALKDQEVDLQGVDAEGKPIKLTTREGKPIKGSELGKAQESTLKEIEDAYGKKVKELKSDPQYKNDLKPGGEVVPGSKLEAELIKVAEAKVEVQRYNDIMLAKGIAKANQKATGSYQQYKNQLWSTTEAIKSNRQLNSDQIEFMSELDPTILADMTGMERTLAARLVKEGTDVMKIADSSYGPKTGPGRKGTIETARNFVEKTKEIQHLEMLMKNDPTLAPQYKNIVERLKKERDISLDLLNSKEKGSLYAKDLPRREKIIAEEQTFVEGAVDKIKEVAGEDAISFKPVESREELKIILEKEGRENIEEILEMDAYFDPTNNTLYTNKEVMVESEATSAATHELGHWFLRNSFKQRNPQTGKLEITSEGIELINEWKKSLPFEQQKIIDKRIKDNYARNKKEQFNKRNAYYEEYITSYIDAVRKGQAKITKKGLTHLMKGSNSAKALKKLGIDVSTPEGLQRFIESLAKSARKGKLSKELIEFAGKQKPKPESKLEKLYKEEVEVKEEIKVKPEGKEKVEVKEEVEEVVEEKLEPVTDKRIYESPKELIKDLEITEADALKEIKEAEEGAIGKRNELIDITTDSKGNRTATMMIGSTTLKDIPISPALEALKFSMNTKRDLKWKPWRDVIRSEFEVGDNTYTISLNNKAPIPGGKGKKWIGGDKIYELSFGLKVDNPYAKDPSSSISKMGIEGTGRAAEVLSIVSNGVFDFVKKNKVDAIGFNSSESSRTRLYDRLTKSWADKLGWEHGSETFTGETPETFLGEEISGSFIISKPGIIPTSFSKGISKPIKKLKSKVVPSKTKQFTAKEQSKIISEAVGAKEKMIEANKLLVSEARVGYQDKAKKNAAAFKKKYGEVLNPTRTRKASNELGIDIARAETESLIGERIPADIAEAYNKSISEGSRELKANEVIKNASDAERVQLGAEELLVETNKPLISRAKNLYKDMPNAKVTRSEWNEMVDNLFRSRDPEHHSMLYGNLKAKGREGEKVFNPDKSALGTFLTNQFVNKAKGLFKTGEYGESGERFRKEVKEDMLTTTTDISEAEVPTASMREEGLKMDPKETKVLESKVTKWINKNLKSLFGEKFTGGVGKVVDRFLSTGLREFAREEITPMLDKRIPKAKIIKKGEGWIVNPKYETFLGENVYPEFMKLMDTHLGSDGLIKGDPYVFISPGGKGYKDFLYKQRGVTESGAPKRVKTAETKEDVAYDWAGSKDFPLPTKKQFVDWHVRRKEYVDWPSRPNELRRKVLDIMGETAIKDLMPKNLKKGSEALKGMSEEQFQDLELATKIEEVTNKILRNPDIVGHKTISTTKRQKMFDDVMNEITHPGTVEFVADMKTFNNLYPLEFDQFLNVQKRGLSLDSFLNKNPHVKKFFRMPIFEGKQEKLYQEKFEPSANTFKKAIKSSKDFPKEVKEQLGNLKPLGGTKDGKRYVELKELKEFKDNLLSLSKELPPKEKDLALGIIDAFLGEGYAESQGSLRNNMYHTRPAAEKAAAIKKLKSDPKYKGDLKSDGKVVHGSKLEAEIRKENKKHGKVKVYYEKKVSLVDGKEVVTFSKEPLNKKGKDGEYLPYEELRSVREQLKDWGENARKDKRYDHIKTKDIIGETSLRQRMGKVWRAPWGEKAKLAKELFPESDAKAKQEMYMEWAKSQEKWLHEAKEGTKEFDSRLKTLARIAGHNTNLTAGMRQFLPTGYLYMPKKLQKYAKGRAKLEHLKPNLGQSIELLEAIYKGEVGVRKEALLKDYTSFFAPEGRLAFLDVIGGTTNMSNLSRLTGDLSILKDVYTRESGFTESVYEKMIREGAKELKLTKSQENAIKENFAADYTNMYLAKGDKASKLGMKQILKPENAKQRKGVIKQNTENSIWGSKSQKPKSISDQVEKMVKADMALENGRKIDKPIKKARVFDFDDTVAKTKSNVLYELADGTKGKLTAEQFAKDGETLLQAGAKFDFSEFNKVMEGKKGPLFDLMKKMKEAAGERDLFILTARSQEAAPAIREFLKGLGVDIPVENITGLGNSTGEAKADWMIEKAAEGYNDFYFADDAIQNVKAVKKVLDQIDVKSKVQQVIASKSKDLNGEFNRILEATTGVEWFKEFSPAKAEVLGKRKGKGKFFLPPGAEDFLGLIYPTIGKGKMGENQLKWYEENLLKPYSRATQSLSTERVNMMADFKRLKKELDVPKDLRKRTESGFTHEQALRVHLWNKQGMEVPGLSKKDLKELSDIVESNPKLKAFSEQLQMILKGDVYSTPKKHWLSGTITTDLIDLLNTTKRDKYLQEWNQNIDIIFSKPNLNKLESIYGKKYREALENSITRMKAGKNRTSTGNRVSDGVLDYINNAQGTIMFLNMRSALLQTISAANFINLGFNNPYKAGKAFANQPQYWKDFVELMNSDYLVDRRNGLKLNISESEIADAAAGSTNKAKAAINYILEKGYIPTKFADSFAIASGGATWYRNRINDLIKKEKLSPEEAKKKAFEEFRDISEKSQQSSDPSKISQQQSSDLGRVVLQFVNTPMQYTRLQKRAFQDLKNKRGDWKSHVSKILYYGIMQNLWFNGMQQGLFALGFGDDEIDEREEKKLYDTANGMSDSILRGLGMGGMTVSVLKNTILDIYSRSQRKRPEYGDAWIKLLGFSPAIKSKMSKLRSAGWPFDSKKRRAEVWDKGFSLDNPAWESLAKVVSATTNVPLDRLFSKYNNLKAISEEDTEMWQGIAMFLGWPEWDIKPDED